jgi:hypothetical protein
MGTLEQLVSVSSMARGETCRSVHPSQMPACVSAAKK